MSDQEFTERYFGVLGSLESQIVGIYREQPELTDYEVGSALDALIKDYRGEAIGHAHRAPQNPTVKSIYERVELICELFLGRAEMEKAPEEGQEEPPEKLPQEALLTADEIVACLKRIRKSVDYWTREAGRRGYLQYMSNFLS
jgi:hypothetical protein